MVLRAGDIYGGERHHASIARLGGGRAGSTCPLSLLRTIVWSRLIHEADHGLKAAEQEESPLLAVHSVDFLHLDKLGNNVKLLTSGRIPSNSQRARVAPSGDVTLATTRRSSDASANSGRLAGVLTVATSRPLRSIHTS